jgi:hypothetical protein
MDPTAPVGSDVVATGSGTIDLTGLSFAGQGNGIAAITPSDGIITTGPTSLVPTDVYEGITGPTSFGSGGVTFTDSGSGDLVEIVGGGVHELRGARGLCLRQFPNGHGDL